MSTLITNIGELVTNAPEDHDTSRGPGPFEARTGAALVIDEGRVAWTGPAGQAPAADDIVDARGRAVLPGFVDSHAHLVFAGERGAEFAARMAGQPYEAGGIRTTVAATRAASDITLRANLRRLADEMARQGTTTFECKSGYGLTVRDEARALMLAAEVTPEVTYLGAHVVPPEYAGDRAGYVDLVCGPMLDACAPYARWIDVFCERDAFDGDETARILAAGQARGLLARVHAGQLGPGPGVQVAVRAGAASADHCTFLTAADVDALAASDTVATLLPAVEFSCRQPYPDAPAAARRGRHRGHRDRLQPGLLLHLEHGPVRGLRRPGHAPDHRRKRCGRPPRAAPGPCAAPTSAISARAPGPTCSCWTPRPTPTWPTAPASRSPPPSGAKAAWSPPSPNSYPADPPAASPAHRPLPHRPPALPGPCPTAACPTGSSPPGPLPPPAPWPTGHLARRFQTHQPH